MEKNVFNEIIWVEQTVTYIETDGTTRVYAAIGNEDSIEVFMPEAEKIDVQYATESIMDLRYRDVTLGVISENGVLYVPEDAKLLVRDYHYKLSVKNDDLHVILDWNTVDGASMLKGDLVLMVHHALPEELTGAQKRTIGGRLAVSVTLQVDGEYITQLGGHADIFVKTDDENIKVYYVDNDGKATLIESNYLNGDTHTSVNHFSIYMYTDEEVSEDFPIIIVIAIIAVVLALIVIFLLWRRKQKD